MFTNNFYNMIDGYVRGTSYTWYSSDYYYLCSTPRSAVIDKDNNSRTDVVSISHGTTSPSTAVGVLLNVLGKTNISAYTGQSLQTTSVGNNFVKAMYKSSISPTDYDFVDNHEIFTLTAAISNGIVSITIRNISAQSQNVNTIQRAELWYDGDLSNSLTTEYKKLYLVAEYQFPTVTLAPSESKTVNSRWGEEPTVS